MRIPPFKSLLKNSNFVHKLFDFSLKYIFLKDLIWGNLGVFSKGGGGGGGVLQLFVAVFNLIMPVSEVSKEGI